jgi:hypothetical protein
MAFSKQPLFLSRHRSEQKGAQKPPPKPEPDDPWYDLFFQHFGFPKANSSKAGSIRLKDELYFITRASQDEVSLLTSNNQKQNIVMSQLECETERMVKVIPKPQFFGQFETIRNQ